MIAMSIRVHSLLVAASSLVSLSLAGGTHEKIYGVCNLYKSKVVMTQVGKSGQCVAPPMAKGGKAGNCRVPFDQDIPRAENAKDYNSNHFRIQSADGRVKLSIWKDDNQNKIEAGPDYGQLSFTEKEWATGDFNLVINEDGSMYLKPSSLWNDCDTGCSALKVHGHWQYMYVVTGTEKQTWQHGTAKKHKESKTETWSHSVSVAVTEGFEFEGETSSVTVTNSESHSIEQMYSDEWDVSETAGFSFQPLKKWQGKVAWQWKMPISDSCQHQEVTLTRDFAITKDASTPPCCLPGHGTDMPYYTTCSKKSTMIPGGKKYGCKIAKGGDENITSIV